MEVKKIRFDCKRMAKCGLTSFSRCRAGTSGLKDCETCDLVNKSSKRWKMIDRKPHKKCKRCGKFLPVDKFYPRKIQKPNGVVYDTREVVCKMCRSEMYKEKLASSIMQKEKAT